MGTQFKEADPSSEAPGDPTGTTDLLSHLSIEKIK